MAIALFPSDLLTSFVVASFIAISSLFFYSFVGSINSIERLKVESNLEMCRGPESLREELQKEVITTDARSCLRALDKIRSQAAVSSGEEAEDAVAIGGAMSQATNASSACLSAPSVSSPWKRKQKTN